MWQRRSRRSWGRGGSCLFCLTFPLSGEMTCQHALQSLTKVFVGWEADEVPHCCCPFFDPLPPNPSCIFQCNGLSSVIRHVNGLRLSSHRSSIGHILVAGGAQHQRFAFPRRHDFDPCWFVSTIRGRKVFECSDMMHLDSLCISCGSTVFADIGKEP